MYIVINNTVRKTFTFTGNWPESFIEHMLDIGNELIVISTYSNTIKIPGGFSEKFEGEREWNEYKYSPDMLQKEGE